MEMTGTRPLKIHAVDRMKEMMAAYYLEAKNAADNKRKIAWINGGGLVELLVAMDVIPVYPENHAAMCGVARMGVELCEVAEQMGYSRDICSYARSDIGSAVTGKSPIMGLPRPDFLLCCNNTCGMITKWYEALARFFDVPLVFIDTPFIHEDLTENAVDYVKRQLRRAIKQMESLLDQKIDMDRLAEVVDISGRATHMWGKVLELCKNIPSPMNAFDGFILMAPIVTLRGTPAVVDFYEMLRQELAGRVENGIAAVEGERYRLLWDNLPIWFRLRNLSEKFIQHKACVVASTYLNGWVAHGLNPNDPIDSLSRTYMSSFINRSLEYRTKMLSEIVKEYSVDGIIFHSNRSCRPYSLGQYDIKDALSAQTGVPGILLEADMNDERAYAEGPVVNRIEAFIETLMPRQEKVAV